MTEDKFEINPDLDINPIICYAFHSHSDRIFWSVNILVAVAYNQLWIRDLFIFTCDIMSLQCCLSA